MYVGGCTIELFGLFINPFYVSRSGQEGFLVQIRN